MSLSIATLDTPPRLRKYPALACGAAMDVGGWLRGLGLEQYEANFRDNKVDAAVLPQLTADDLKDIGVAAVGDRWRQSGRWLVQRLLQAPPPLRRNPRPRKARKVRRSAARSR